MDPPPDVNEQAPAPVQWSAATFRLQQELKIKRSLLTRTGNRADELLEVNGDSPEDIQRLRVQKESLQRCLDELTSAFNLFTIADEIATDFARVEREFGRQENYEADARERLERLQAKLNAADNLLSRPASSVYQSPETTNQQEHQDIAPESAEQEFADEQEQSATYEQSAQSHLPSPVLQNYDAGVAHQPPWNGAPFYPHQDPAAKVPKFNGDPTKFEEFWHLFHYFVDSQPMDVTEKCRIFKNALVGKAAKQVCCIQTRADCYTIMKDTIRRQFGDTEYMEDAHVHRILSSCGSKQLDRDDKFLDFVTIISQNLHALVSLGNSLESLSCCLAPVIQSCFPPRYAKKFTSVWKRDKEDQTCKLASLLSFLEDQATIIRDSSRMNLIQRDSHAPRDHSKQSRNNEYQRSQGFQKASQTQVENNKSQFAFAGQVSEISCIFCEKNHVSSKCSKRMTPDERLRVVTEKKACSRCLRLNHVAKNCRAKVSNCNHCGGKHSNLLCLNRRPDSQSNAGASAAAASSQVQANVGVSSGGALQTGYVWAVNGKRKIICRVILDTGSQRSFISKRAAEHLKLKIRKSVTIRTHKILGEVSPEQQVEIVDLKLRSRFSDKQITISCLTVPKVIEGLLPTINLGSDLHPLADSKEAGFPDEVDLLLGVDALHQVFDGMYRKFGSVVASPTIFGWFVWGDGGANSLGSSVHTSLGVVRSVHEGAEPNGLSQAQSSKQNLEGLQFLWETEFLGIENSSADEDKTSLEEMENFFKSTIRTSPEGRYIVSLPFKENWQTLGDNQKLAYSRLMALLKNLKKSPVQLRAVDLEISKIIDSGYAELAPPREPTEKAHYLPILAVAKKSLAGSEEPRVRLVKDGGARSREESSLNDVLEKGPNYLPDILVVLTHFRRRPIAIVADIKSAFNQFLIDEKHRTFLRFYWPTGISDNPSAPVKEYCATVLDFGLVCSPWLHCAGIRHHLDLQMVKRPQQKHLLAEIKKFFYMDDLSTGAHSLAEAKSTVATLVDVFRDGKFPLSKWATNSPELAQFIREAAASEQPAISCGEKAKFLGIAWNQISDTLFIPAKEIQSFLRAGTPSKRRLLKGLSQLFDPLNFLAPISIKFKMLTQVLWSEKIDWDTPLTGALAEAYGAAVDNLDFASSIEVPRKIFAGRSTTAKRELHVFADSSLRGYGCVLYVRELNLTDPNSRPAVSFLMAKARVTPLKGKWTISRLELLAAVLAARVANKLMEALRDDIDEVFYYSDNASVLAWIRGPADRWKQFVANRIVEIQSLTASSAWSYVRSEHNPADLASRSSPLNTPELRSFWLQGPDFLANGESQEYHTLNPEPPAKELIAEKKAEIISAVAITFEQDRVLIPRQLSSWQKTVRVTAYVLRFVRRARGEKRQQQVLVGTREFIEAEMVLLKNIQRAHFGSVIDSGGENIPKANALSQFNPYVDGEGLLRCRSRLEKSSNIDANVKFPIILPGEDFRVQLMIRSIHAVDCMHSGGIAAILHVLRKKFFVKGARRAANKAVSGCKVCVRFRAKAASEPMAPLPAFRIEESAPFTFVGVDHAGPIFVKNETGDRVKSYILIFACAVTRAVRLELVPDLSTEEFLLALRRFLSRNPAVRRLVSDNARTFLKAEKELALIFDNVKHPKVQSLLQQKRLEWSHSTQKASWHGAFWERLIQTVKRPLRKALMTQAFTFRQTEVLLCEIEKMVNDRPISALIVDPNEPRALSPSDLLYGYASQAALPETKQLVKTLEAANSIVFSQRWRAQQAALRGFWRQFQNEYLQYLRSAHCRKKEDSRPLQPGDVCLMQSSEPSRAFWPLCVVQSLFGGEGSDRRQRSCVVKTVGGKLLKRPIQLLYPLEVSQF